LPVPVSRLTLPMTFPVVVVIVPEPLASRVVSPPTLPKSAPIVMFPPDNVCALSVCAVTDPEFVKLPLTVSVNCPPTADAPRFTALLFFTKAFPDVTLT
jgi:hypothetical protein